MVCITWERSVPGITVVFPKILTRLINFVSMTLNLESGVLCGLTNSEGAYYS
jgi:hypothetical protein